MASLIEKLGIPVTLVADAAVGYIMERVDLVMVGAEAIVESGGIYNTTGTYLISVMAKAANKPFYIVGESFKFLREYPLSQKDANLTGLTTLDTSDTKVKLYSPATDYTPPGNIALLFTDIGLCIYVY